MDPWFKFYASDYLLDPKVDALPLEAQAILVRLWCLSWRDGALTDYLPGLARRCLVPEKTFRKHWEGLEPFFEHTDAGLISPRMEKERALSKAKAEAHRFGAEKTNAKRYAKRQLQDQSETSLSDTLSAHSERVAQASPSESESERKLPPTPFAARKGRRPRAPKPDPFAEYPEPIVDAVNEIGALCPAKDPDGRSIRIDPAKLIERVDGLCKVNAAITGPLLVQSWADYIASKPMKIKAPQYFFGDASDNRDGANWHPFARLIWHRLKKAAERVEPLLLGVTA